MSDNNWIQVQKKTFTKWFNSKLELGGYKPLMELFGDLEDGTKLIHLLEVIGNESLGKFYKAPKFRVQMVENLNLALHYVQSKNVKLTNIGSEDIVDSNPKLILGLIWSIILRFTIADIEQDGLGAKDGLLLWCQRKTKEYHNVNIKDFTGSWKDGLGFLALIHKHYPELVDYEALNPANKYENVELAFKLAEEKLGIPKLLDVEDLCDVPNPDERSMMTYVAQYYHALNNLDKKDISARRLANFLNLIQSTTTAKNLYEKKARELVNRITEVREELSAVTVEELCHENTKQLLKNNNYSTEKIEFYEKQLSLIHLLSVIQTKLFTYKLPNYTPPAELSIATIHELIREFDLELEQFNEALKSHMKKLKMEFNELFNTVYNNTQSQKKLVEEKLAIEMDKLTSEHTNDIDQTISQVDTLLTQLGQLIEERKGTNLVKKIQAKFNQINKEVELLRLNFQAKDQFIQNHLLNSKSNLTPAQIEELEYSFKYFDKDHSNSLDKQEFQFCLSSLGYSFNNNEVGQEFEKSAGGKTHVSYQQFLAYMKDLIEDKVSKKQIKDAFDSLSKDMILSLDTVQNLNLNKETLDFVAENVPVKDGLLDYDSFLDQIFIS